MSPAAESVLLLCTVVALVAVLAVLAVTVWNRVSPRPARAPRQLLHTTCGVLVPVAEAKPLCWVHDAGGVLLSVAWNGRAYMVPRAQVPRGLAEQLPPPRLPTRRPAR